MNNNLAVVGCYYFPDGSHLINAIEEQNSKEDLPERRILPGGCDQPDA